MGSSAAWAAAAARVGRLPMLVMVCVVLAAAGPYWGKEQTVSQTNPKDLLLLLDVSRSMLAEDQPPDSRLLRARRQIFDLLDLLEEKGRTDRVALIAFAGPARLLSPFTRDYDHLRAVVRTAGPELFAAADRMATPAGLALPRALALAAEWLPDTGSPRAVVLISDGDGIEAPAAALADVLRPLACRLDVFAVGDPNRPWRIPTGDREVPFLLRENEGSRETVWTRREHEVLAALAALGQGELVREEELSLKSWWLHAGDRLPGQPTSESGPRRNLPRYGWLTAAALLLLGWRFLPAMPARPWVVLGLGVLPWGMLGLGTIPIDRRELWRGQEAFRRGNFSEALAHYSAALPSSTDPGQVSFNQGACFSRLGRWEEAAEAYLRTLEDAEGQRAVLAWLGRGHALAHLGAAKAGPAAVPILVHALRCFAEADSLLPVLPHSAMTSKLRDDLAHNRSEVEKLLARKRQEPPPPTEDSPPKTLPPDEGEMDTGPGAADGIGRIGSDIGPGEAGSVGRASDQANPGAGNLPLTLSAAGPMSAKEAERLLDATLRRLEQVQRHRGQGPAILPAGERDW